LYVKNGESLYFLQTAPLVVPDQKVAVGAGLNVVFVYTSSERWTEWGVYLHTLRHSSQ